MGGRGTFGTKQNKLDRDSIVKTLVSQGIKIAIDGKILSQENLKKLNNSDLSILKDFIGREEAKGITINLSNNFKTEDLGKPIVQKSKTTLTKSGKKTNVRIFQVNRSIYQKRGMKYFNRMLNEGGYGKSIKHVALAQAKKTNDKVKKPTTNKLPKPPKDEAGAMEHFLKYFGGI